MLNYYSRGGVDFPVDFPKILKHPGSTKPDRIGPRRFRSEIQTEIRSEMPIAVDFHH